MNNNELQRDFQQQMDAMNARIPDLHAEIHTKELDLATLQTQIDKLIG